MKTNPVKVDIYNADICLYIYIYIYVSESKDTMKMTFLIFS